MRRFRYVVRLVEIYGSVLVFFLLISSSSAVASTYIPLDDRVYDTLLRLEAEGVIQSGLLTTRPISRRELIRLLLEAERNCRGKSPFVQKLVNSLRKRFHDDFVDTRFIKPVDVVYSKYLYSDSKIRELYYNNDDDDFEKGSNLRFGFLSNVELGWVSFFLNPELRYSDRDTDFTMKRVYGLLSFSGFDLEVGKDSQWWGPGYHGSLLLSNNSEPFRMIKLTNPQPMFLPWIFRYIGPFRFSFFVTRLEDERALPEPYLWGVRFNFKPMPYIEIGLQRTAISGGNENLIDLDTWKSFTGNGDTESGVESDRKTGFDIKLTLPFKWQPFQVYLEAAGEDEKGGLPNNWAYLGGLYLPRIFLLERLDFRVEYASNHISEQPNYWYNHNIYRSGYTYKGRIIGHHMGTDSSDMFFEMNYRLPKMNSRLKVSYDVEKHNLSGRYNPTKTEASIGLRFDMKSDLGIEGKYTFGKLENTDDDSDEKINLFMLNLDYNF